MNPLDPHDSLRDLGCPEQRRTLLAWLDRALDAGARLEFERHLEHCDACRAAADFERALEPLLHRAVGADFDAGFEARTIEGVHRRIAEQDARPAASPIRRRAGILVVLAAAAAVMIVAKRREEIAPPIAPDRATDRTASADREASADRDARRRAQDIVRNALLVACRTDDFATAFRRETEPLAREDWPVDTLLRGAIDDAEPAVANAAIHGAIELELKDALPAIQRAARKRATAASALEAMAALGDALCLPQLERALDDPELEAAGIAGLARLKSPYAARVLGERLQSEGQADAAARALADMGEPGIAELLVRARRGSLLARETLTRSGLPTRDQLDHLLLTRAEPELARALLHELPRFGDAALPAVLSLLAIEPLHAEAIDAAVAMGSEPAAAALLAARERRQIGDGEAIDALRRLLACRLDPAPLALALARSHGDVVVRALALDRRTDVLGLALEDDGILPGVRALAALELADQDALAPRAALAIALQAAMHGASDAAALLLCAAARAGATDADARELKPVHASSAKALLKRAETVGRRWKRDGRAPLEWEQKLLAREIESALEIL